VEDTETRDAQQRETEHRIQHLQGILKQRLGIIEDPIDNETAKDNNGAINNENAPVRQ
jgi:hypothetical protein